MNCPHCDTPIDEHEASRCLDAWVAEAVMGWKPYLIVSYNILYPPHRQASADEHPVIYEPFRPDRPYEFDSEHFYNSSQTPPFTQPMVPSYSTSIAAAWEVVMHFKDRQYSVVLEGGDAPTWSRWDFSIWSPLDDPDFSDEMAHGWDESRDLNDRLASAPLAICRAAIKAVCNEPT